MNSIPERYVELPAPPSLGGLPPQHLPWQIEKNSYVS